VTSIDLVHQALDVNDANLSLGNEVFEAAGATFVRNRDAPDIYDANHVTNIKASSGEEIDALFVHAEEEFAGFRHRRFDTDHRTHPEVIARLRLEDYERNEGLVMLLQGMLNGQPPDFKIRPVVSDDDWNALAGLKRDNWTERREGQGRPLDPEVCEAAIRVERGKCPPAQYFLAGVEGSPVAYLNAWAGIDGVGQVEDLFTHPSYRDRGLATALIHRCVAACRENGAGPVVIVADPTDTPKRLYARLGFRPVAVTAHYLKRLDA
jgi:GNAT superfamily N-acetyltransferase